MALSMGPWGYHPTYRRSNRSFSRVYVSSSVDQKFDFPDTTIAMLPKSSLPLVSFLQGSDQQC